MGKRSSLLRGMRPFDSGGALAGPLREPPQAAGGARRTVDPPGEAGPVVDRRQVERQVAARAKLADRNRPTWIARYDRTNAAALTPIRVMRSTPTPERTLQSSLRF